MKSKKPRIVDIELAAVERLVARAKEVMTEQEYELLKGLVETLLTLLRLVREGRTTIARLRRLFGLAQSEKTADVLASLGPGGTAATTTTGAEGPAPQEGVKPPGGVKSTEEEKPRPKGHGRDAASDYSDACELRVLHEWLRPGDPCPECGGHGTLYEMSEDATILRILGQAPLVGRCWKCQRLRCSGCGFIFTAAAPPEAQGPKHDATAAAMIAHLRFRAGMPHNRLAQIQRNLRTPLPASTQWDVIWAYVPAPLLVYRELCRLAAQGTVLHTDDTYMRILAFMGKRRAKLVARGVLAAPDRTGLFTTGIVSIASRTLALFFTGRKHAGENLADLLCLRAAGLDPAMLMCDGLDRNVPKGHAVVESNCGAHARRQYVDQAVNWPRECRYVLETYGKVFKIDELCRKEGLSDEERLRRHQAESGPLMAEIKTWGEKLLEEKRVEPNSGLGDAINYMLDRWEKLTLFLRVPGAALHNNIVERSLKMSIRHRNNSLFYRNTRGALVGDVYMSVIYTAELAGENGLQYLTELMRHEKAVAADPAAWLPWNYRATLARLDAAKRPQEEPPRPSVSRPPTSRPMGPRPPAPSAPSPSSHPPAPS